MELAELYNQMQNAIDDPKVIEKLIATYSNSSQYGFYNQLTRLVHKEHNKGLHHIADSDKFFSLMFNQWKNNIVAITDTEFEELNKNGEYDESFIKLREYLKGIADVSTKKAADEILYGKKVDKELEEAMKKYRWNRLGDRNAWIYVSSKDVNAKQENNPIVEHRLYLNTESFDTYKMVTLFVEKCDARNLPYGFKFNRYANSDDTIVIYSSTENLSEYIDILQEIKREYPDLVAKVKEPPILTGKIDNWIGYGSQPTMSMDVEEQTFNGVRSKLFEAIISRTTKKWILDHRNLEIVYKGQRMTFQDFVVKKSVDSFLVTLEQNYNVYLEAAKKYKESTGSSFNREDVVNALGYDLQDLRSLEFKEMIYTMLKDDIVSCLDQSYMGGPNKTDSISMVVKNDRVISFTGYDLEKIIGQIAVKIIKKDSTFIPSIQSQIKHEATLWGIDADKFCFDIKSRESLKSSSKSQAKATANTISKPIAQFLEKHGFDLNHLPSSFSKMISGTKNARKNDMDFTLTCENFNYKNKEEKMVSVSDIIGTFGFVDNFSLLDYVSELYNEKDAYGQNALENLQKDLFTNTEQVLKAEPPIKLIEMNGKYYVSQDGNHRAFYLLLVYLMTMEQSKNNPETVKYLNNYFRIKAEVVKKSGFDIIDKICYCMSKCWNADIKLEFSIPNSPMGAMYINNQRIDITSEEEFLHYFTMYLSSLDKSSKKYTDLADLLSKNGFANLVSPAKEPVKESDSQAKDTKFQKNEPDISNILDAELMNKRMKLPDGSTLSAKEYVQNIVYPQLPKNGIVILSDPKFVLVKTFIEEYVMGECQEKYNGDFPTYMAQKTRKNLETITIGTKEEQFEINPKDITDFINPNVLEKLVKLPDGNFIPVKQYIREIYAPHIPANGRVMLNDGIEVSVKQYIENVLFGVDFEKYNGDIGKILYHTTRYNDGSITVNLEQIKEELMQIQEKLMQMQEQMAKQNQEPSTGNGTKK